jgi:hypothetical protein
MSHSIQCDQPREPERIIPVNNESPTLAFHKMVNSILTQLNPNYMVFFGTIGLSVGLAIFAIFLYRRIRYLISRILKRQYSSPKLIVSLRNLVLILLWCSLFGMMLFVGFFLHAYHVFTFEKPVATIEITPTEEPQTMKVHLIHLADEKPILKDEFTIRGDQWSLEGDILKWDNWINFMGLETRYRFTRIRGRYIRIADEIEKENSVYSLVKEEDHPFWRYLYRYGNKLPFVSTVYGNAIFQYGDKHKKFLIFVSPSGFVVREI